MLKLEEFSKQQITDNDDMDHQRQEKAEENRIRHTLMAFAGSTSAHGIGKLISPLWYVQALWLVLIVSALSGLAYHMSTMIGKFLLEPVSTSVTLRGVDFVYPGVTVCNKKFLSVSAMAEKVNRSFRRTKVPIVLKEDDLTWSWTKDCIEFFRKLNGLSNLVDQTGKENMLKQDAHMSLTSSKYLMLNEDFKHNLAPLMFRDSDGIASFTQYSLHPEKLLVRCRFGPHACDISDFSVVQMHDNPYCITFNVSSVQTKNLLTRNDVNSYGLELYYYTDSSHFNSQILLPELKLASDAFFRMNSNGGADLYIHQSGAYPGTGNKIEVPNGYKATVSVTYQEFQFVNIGKRQCLDSYPADYMNYWQRTDSGAESNVAYSYTNTDCFFKQLQTFIYQQCGCLSYDYPVPSSLKADEVTLCLNITQAYIFSNINKSQTLDPSSTTNFLMHMVAAVRKQTSTSHDIQAALFRAIHQFSCQRAVVSSFQVRAAALCTERCRSSQYSMQTSLYTWPSENPQLLSEDLLKWLESNVYYRNNETVLNETFLREVNRGIYDILTQVRSRGASIGTSNFLSIKLDVADKSGKSTITEESLSYQEFDLLSDIGGILGLYLGVSVLTLCEVLELMLGLIYFAVSRVRSRRRVQQQQQQQQQLPGVIIVQPVG